MPGEVRELEQEGGEGGSTELRDGERVGSLCPISARNTFRLQFGRVEGRPGGRSLGVPPRVALAGLPYLASWPELWAGPEERGGGSPAGRCAARAARPRSAGRGVGTRGGLRLHSPPHSTPRAKQTLSAAITPPSGGGRGHQGNCPSLLPKGKGGPGSFAAASHARTMHPRVSLLGHRRGLNFLS